jgi:DNA primase
MPGFFTSGSVERIRAASDIVDVIGSYLPLKKAGANFMALCPFHKEKTPSFNVHPQKQIFHCFGCHKGGDVFTFVKEYENIDFPEAVRRLADRAKIPLEYESGGGEDPGRPQKQTLLEIHEQIAQRWQSALANEASGQIARDYLARRGVPAEAVTLFRLGYAPDLWDDTVNWARGKGYDPTLMEKSGLIVRKEGSDHHYDRFRGRLMFPICDEQGRVIAFSGRILSGDEKTAKYVNSPETPIFTKSKVFFGLDKSKRAILDEGFAVVCEGQLDLIACFMGGVQNIVAPQGTAFTDDHARILRRYAEEVVLCFDSDEAGQNAAVRSLEHLLGSGLAVRVAVVPRPHDPDSFIKEKGAAAFKQLINSAEGFFDYYLNRLCSGNDTATDKGRLSILKQMAEATYRTRNDVLIDKYAQKTALRLAVSPESVRLEFRKYARYAPASSQPPGAAEETELAQQVASPTNQEYWLLRIAMTHDDLVPWLAAHLDQNWVQHPYVKLILEKRVQSHDRNTWLGLPDFLSQLPTPDLQGLVTEVTAVDRPIPKPEQQLQDILTRLRNQSIDREMNRLMHQAGQPETPDTVRIELLTQKEQLRLLKATPLAPLLAAEAEHPMGAGQPAGNDHLAP